MSENASVLPVRSITDEETAMAFVLGVLFNQRMRGTDAWEAPYTLKERIGGLRAADILALDENTLGKVFAAKPAIHPFTATMAAHTSEAAQIVADRYSGDARNIWQPTVDAREFINRFIAFPGIGEHKAQVALFVATVVLGIPVRNDGGDYSIESCGSLASLFYPMHNPQLVSE